MTRLPKKQIISPQNNYMRYFVKHGQMVIGKRQSLKPGIFVTV